MASAKPQEVFSKVSVKSQTVLPLEVRRRLGIGPGDKLRYIIGETGVTISKLPAPVEHDPFVAFAEWSSPEDDEAFADL